MYSKATCFARTTDKEKQIKSCVRMGSGRDGRGQGAKVDPYRNQKWDTVVMMNRGCAVKRWCKTRLLVERCQDKSRECYESRNDLAQKS